MKTFLTIIFLGYSLLFNTKLWAQSLEAPKVYMIKDKESLDSIATKFLPRYKSKYSNRIEDYKRDLMEWNPHITSWESIPFYSNIYIEYPYPSHLSHRYAEKLQAEKNYNVLNADAETPFGTKKYTVYTMFTASAGNFEEELTTKTGKISSTQNSPLSLGIGTTILLDRTNRMISSSFYWSHLRESKLSGEGLSSNSLKSKDEIGFNLYYQQLTPWSEVSLYGGMDYEQFSTFNTLAFANGQNLDLNENKIFYGTLGAAKTFFWDDKKILVKGSLSQSLKSSTTSSNPIDKFEGQRLLLFASFKGESRFTYHILYKRHMLEGPTNLTINRIGAGIGFVLF